MNVDDAPAAGRPATARLARITEEADPGPAAETRQRSVPAAVIS